MASFLVDKVTFATVFETEELLYYDVGVFRPNGEGVVKDLCETHSPNCTSHFVNEVVSKIKRRTYWRREEFDRDVFILNFRNGFFDLRTGRLLSHGEVVTPHERTSTLHETSDLGPLPFLSRIQVPHDYDEGITQARRIVRFLCEALPDPKERRVFLEYAAICLFRSQRFQKALMLVGQGNNGKSTAISVLKTLLGKENVSTVSIHDISNGRFGKAELDAKLANLYPDISSGEIEHTGALKAIIAGDSISAEKKGRDPFTMDAFTKLIFSCNQLPEIKDNTLAWWRRWSLVDFKEDFSGRENRNLVNEDLTGELQTKEEMSGFLYILVNVLRGVLRAGRLSETQTNEQRSKEWGERADHVRIFVRAELLTGPTFHVRKAELYKAYIEWCWKKKFIPRGKQRFNQELPSMALVTPATIKPGGRSSKAEDVWKGIRLRSEADSTVLLPEEQGTGPEDSSGTVSLGTGSGSSGSSGDSLPTLFGPNSPGRKDPEHPEHPERKDVPPSADEPKAPEEAQNIVAGACPRCNTEPLDPQLHYKLDGLEVCRTCWTKDAIERRKRREQEA